jgi:hypothetical protein
MTKEGPSGKAGKGPGNSGGGGKRALSAPPHEDASTLVPCPVTTTHPNGFVERADPDRETHEVRYVSVPAKQQSNPQKDCVRRGEEITPQKHLPRGFEARLLSRALLGAPRLPP